MANSQNGWPVDASGADQDRNPIYGNVAVPNGVLKGDVATVLRYVAMRFHETVEPLKPGTCWGWFNRDIRGSASISNHASGTAIDLNADRHPLAVAASKTFTAKQITACHAIVKACDGVVRWGGDYTGRPDPMHWEIVGSKAQAAALAEKIRTEEDDVLSPDDRKWLVSLLNGGPGDVVPRWSDTGGPVAANDPNPTQTPASALYYGGATAKRVENLCADILTAVGQVDDQVLAGLRDAGQSLDTLATVIVGALGIEKATALGRLLAGS